MTFDVRPPPAQRRILGGGGLRTAMPWIVAVMSFTMLLAAAGGLAVTRAAGALGQAIESRYAITLPASGVDPEAVARRLRALPDVLAAEAVSEAAMRQTLRQWLGPAADSRDLPVPSLITVDLQRSDGLPALRNALSRIAPGADLSAYGAQLGPLLESLRLLQILALALILLLGAAAAAAVAMAARATLDSQRSTVDVLHGIGATDDQVTRLFQHRVTVDTLIGSVAGAALAAVVLLLAMAGARWLSDMGGVALGPLDVAMLGLLPLVLTVAATLAARYAILTTLRREL